MRQDWALYVNRDPSWPRVRDEWVARGGVEKAALVENLITSMVRSYDSRGGGHRAEFERARDELRTIGAQAAPHLVEVMRARNDLVVQKLCADVLIRIGPPAVPALLEATKGGSVYSRSRAVFALRRIRDPSSRSTLEAVLAGDPEWAVRREAASALGELGDASALPALVKALGDSDPEVRHAVAASLGLLRDSRAVEPLLAAWKPDEAPEVAQEIRRSISRITGLPEGADRSAVGDWLKKQGGNR